MKKTVKGFTLVELIIVVAIFSVIMFGALRLVTPVMRMMVQADVNEGGNAAVASISQLLETELSTVEYMSVKNSAVNEAGRASMVNDFVDVFYEGVLASGSTVGAERYATAKVHVLQIDNTDNGKISTWVYDVTFDPSATSAIVTGSSPVYREYAVNKAYYDSYSFELKPGTYDTIADFDGAVFVDSPDPANPLEHGMGDLLMNFSARETAFTIKATTTRNDMQHSFLTTSTMSLVNISERGHSPVRGIYYCVDERMSNDPVPVLENVIVDRGSSPLTNYNMISSAIKIDATNSVNANDGYTFVYTYGAEINTQTP